MDSKKLKKAAATTALP